MVAQHNVATAYFEGRGVEENLEQARLWYTRAAEQGFAQSEWMLGRIYYEGLGVPTNRDEAIKWLSKSLAQGHVPTMRILADMYTNASGIPLQPQFVFDLERGAAQAGSHAAELQVGRIYREIYLGAPDYAQAMVWFNQAAAGYGSADQYLGAMYELGQGVPVDLAQARSHYERAAELGVSGAIQKMGTLYRDGQGVPVDPVSAYMWFWIGAKMGAAESQNSLTAMKPLCSPVQRMMAEARANTWAVEHPTQCNRSLGTISIRSGLRWSAAYKLRVVLPQPRSGRMRFCSRAIWRRIRCHSTPPPPAPGRVPGGIRFLTSRYAPAT